MKLSEKIKIIYEEETFLVIDKQNGITTHPGIKTKKEKTLWEKLITEKKINLENFPQTKEKKYWGIVHRLDKQTTGVMVIAKNNKTHVYFSKQFLNKKVKKHYLIIVCGRINEDYGRINFPIGKRKKFNKQMIISKTGKDALTNFKVIKR
jgi:23S rRNA pseudouridine1911/1915/1917 synthase